MSLNLESATWFCHACNDGGGLLKFEKRLNGGSDEAAWEGVYAATGASRPQRTICKPKARVYVFQEANGKPRYEVHRFPPKEFRHCHIDASGNRVWNMEGIERLPYHLPDLLAAEIVFVAEGEKDVETLYSLNLCSKPSLEGRTVAATCNSGGAGKWSPKFGEYFKGKIALILEDNDDSGRAHAQDVLRSVVPHAANVKLIKLPGLAVKGDVSDWMMTHTAEDLLQEVDATPVWDSESASRVPTSSHEAVTAPLTGSHRFAIELRGDDRTLGDFAAELGERLRHDLYLYNRIPVIVDEGKIRAVAALELRSRAEYRVVPYRVRPAAKGTLVNVNITMTESDARGTLASPQFHAKLRPLKHLATIRMPVMRANGQIELLPAGYDAEAQTLTVCDVTYPDDLPFDEAVAVVRDLFCEFEFADGSRSESVAVAALVGLYAQHLLPAKSLRPVFIYQKNSEGSGGTTCAACAIVPIIGNLPTGTMAGNTEKMRKLLTSTLLEGRRVVFLDNAKTKIGGDALEAFTSAPTWRDRLLGLNETVELENTVTVFATGNGATCTPDMRRRSLLVELHLSVERAEDRRFKRPLNVSVLRAMRPRILAAIWSVVRHWDALGRPLPSRSHSAFLEFAKIIGGIVEAAGFACPFTTPASSTAVDEDGDDMRALVGAMQLGRNYLAPELYSLCRTTQVFMHLVGLHDGDMSRSELSSLGKLLARYHHRLVGGFRFVIAGTRHARRFFIEDTSLDPGGWTVGDGRCHDVVNKDNFAPGRYTIPTVRTIRTHKHEESKKDVSHEYVEGTL